MNERLHDLIDGELGNAALAETLRELTENPDQQTEFQQILQLRNQLGHNAEYTQMSSREEAEMLDWLHETIDYKLVAVPAAGKPMMMAVVVLIVGLFIGTGLGYLMNNWLSPDANVETNIPEEQLLHPPQTDSANIAPSFNRDSVITAIRDSLQQAMEEEATTNKAPRRRSRKYNIPKAVAGE